MVLNEFCERLIMRFSTQFTYFSFPPRFLALLKTLIYKLGLLFFQLPCPTREVSLYEPSRQVKHFFKDVCVEGSALFIRPVCVVSWLFGFLDLFVVLRLQVTCLRRSAADVLCVRVCACLSLLHMLSLEDAM